MGPEGLRQAYDMEPPCVVLDSECLFRTDREKATTVILLSGHEWTDMGLSNCPL